MTNKKNDVIFGYKKADIMKVKKGKTESLGSTRNFPQANHIEPKIGDKEVTYRNWHQTNS